MKQRSNAAPMRPCSTLAVLACPVLALAGLSTSPAGAAPPPGDDGKQLMRVTTHTGTLDCADRHVEVLADGAELTFTGRCLEMYFLGRNTRATVESATLVQVVADDVSIAVSGALGELRQLGSRASHRLQDTQSIYLPGDDNEVTVKSAGELEVLGSRNRVQWASGKPVVNDLGSGNQLKGL